MAIGLRDDLGAPPSRGQPHGRASTYWLALALVLATAAAYLPSLAAPFILDDVRAVQANPSLKGFLSSLRPPAGTPESGRPVLNASFALNVALGGTDPVGFHVANLAIHAAAGLVLFGIARRTFRLPLLGAAGDADALGFLVALAWCLHPLNTEAVTYVSERAESLMGLFYLLTLYGFIRFRQSAAPAWAAASVLACALGTLTKEVIVTAPLAVLLYDRTFGAGSFRDALRVRGPYYGALAGTWLLLAYLMAGNGGRGVGLGGTMGAGEYALTSCRSMLAYLGLSLWPDPLVFDYGAGPARALAGTWVHAAAFAAIAGLVAWALARRPVPGFAAAWFFGILAPTTSVVPLSYQPFADHRAYLSLAALVAAVGYGLYRLAGRRALALLAAAAAVLGTVSFQRNEVYRTAESLWSDTVAKAPDSARAHTNLAQALSRIPGRSEDAIREDERSLALDPSGAEAHNNLGLLLAQSRHDLPGAAVHFAQAVRLRPDFLEAGDNLGMALTGIPGRLQDAIETFHRLLAVAPGYAKAHNDLGVALARLPGGMQEAASQFAEAARLDPGSRDAQANLEAARQALAQEPVR